VELKIKRLFVSPMDPCSPIIIFRGTSWNAIPYRVKHVNMCNTATGF